MTVDFAIPRKTLHDELVTLLRNMIVTGGLRPGQRISEQRLCARFGVSRTPLREALKVLSAEGLVRLSPNKSASVVRVTRNEVEEIIPILGALEGLGGELACARITDAAVARIRAMHDQMLGHYRRCEAAPYFELNRAIHQAIFEAAGNKTLMESHDLLESRLRCLLAVAPKTPRQWAAAVDDHERMMEALEAQNGAQLAVIARQHIRHRADVMLQALDLLDARTDNAVD